jgi:phosphoglucomutase
MPRRWTCFLRPHGAPHDYLSAYITDLANVLDMDAIRAVKLSMEVDPLGGAGVRYWGAIAGRYGFNLTVVIEAVDLTFRFMAVDWEGQIRLDSSFPYAMQRLIGLKDRFESAFACDAGHDRRGIASTQSLPFPTPTEVAQDSGGWQNAGEQPFAARPSGTEHIYKIHAESFLGADHLRRIPEEAQTIVGDALAASPRQPGIPSEPKLEENP